jgi:ABC-type branched-subunit amino acid transport system ATPase component
MRPLLEVDDLHKAYQGVRAVAGVSLAVAAGSVTGLIGPNGSGKSTLFDCITGFQRGDAGVVRFDSREIGGVSPAAIARGGLRRTFQQLKIFPELTVLENLLTAAQASQGFSLAAELLRSRRVAAAERAARERAHALLGNIGMADQVNGRATALSYGQKKLVELAMALMNEPRLVLLDEPVAGVNPALIERIKAHLLSWRDRGVTFFVIEHNLKLVFDICDRVFVLDRGRILAAGPPCAVAEDPRVIEAYLGSRTGLDDE